VEDVRHFILECPAYAAIRTHPRYAALFVNDSYGDPISAQLRAIFSHKNQALSAECIFLMWELRRTILQDNIEWDSDTPFLPPRNFQFNDWWQGGLTDDHSADLF
jgi:hypothetical protein